MVIVLIATHIAAFVLGALVFRNNAKAANAAITSAQSTISGVTSAANVVVADVKKA